MTRIRLLVATVLFVAIIGALLLPAASSESTNNPGENSTNQPGNQPSDP